MEEVICNKCKIPSYTASPKQARICPHCYGLGIKKLEKVKELSKEIRKANSISYKGDKFGIRKYTEKD